MPIHKVTLQYQRPTILLMINFPHTFTQSGLSRSSHGPQIMIMSICGFTMTMTTTFASQVLAFQLLLKAILTTGIAVESSGSGSISWYYQWNVSIPGRISEDISTFWLLMADSDTGDYLAWSRRLSILSPGELLSAVPSVVTSYVLTTPTMDSFTATTTVSAASSPSDDSESVPEKDSRTDSGSSKSWTGIVAGLGGLWGLTLLSLAGFCFYRNRKRRVKQQHESRAISSNLVPYHTENTEPAPPFTSEMTTTRQFPDVKPPITGRESLTALPSTEGRSTTHNSLVSELAA